MIANRRGIRRRAVPLAVVVMLVAGCGVVRQMSNVQPVSLTTGIVSGHVLDDWTGRPIEDVSVLLLDANGDSLSDDQQHQARAYGPDGAFRFISVRPGTYRLRASASGFDPSTSEPFVVTVNASTIIDLRLRSAQASH